jgi:hypothetical protein
MRPQTGGGTERGSAFTEKNDLLRLSKFHDFPPRFYPQSEEHARYCESYALELRFIALDKSNTLSYQGKFVSDMLRFSIRASYPSVAIAA